MRLTTVIIITTLMQVSAAGFAQKISLSKSNTPLKSILKEIRKQSGYDFVYTEDLLRKATPVSIRVNQMQIEEVLEQIFDEQPLSYSISSKTVILADKKSSLLNRLSGLFADITVKGKVSDENGLPLPGALIRIKDKKLVARTSVTGDFEISVPEGAILEVSYVGFKTQELALQKNTKMLTITLSADISKLDEISVEGYRKGSQRLATSNISKISSEELMKQPVSNPIQALEGRIAGMVVSQTTGVPGARVNVQVRGRSNFDRNLSSDQPLYIVDGVPVAAGNDKVNVATGPFGSVTGEGLSAFAGLNAADIESIDVLKDADATAIYGSRGANGVILITTKKGKAGKMKMTATVYSGISTVTKMPEMLNTEQYLAMRNEAFKNDNLTKTNTNAYDLLLWDQNRYTDFAKLMVGNSAGTQDAQLNFSGGSRSTQYRLGGGYHREGTVWPGDMSSDRASLSYNTHSISENEKFTMDFSGIYSISKSNLAAGDLASAVLLPPNFKLYNADGSLSWSEGGYSTANAKDNPLGTLNQRYKSNMTNLSANLVLNYKITNELVLRSSFGYNSTQNDDKRIVPVSAQNPFKANLTGFTTYGNGSFKNWIVEPQLQYTKKISEGKLDVLLGATYNKRNTTTLSATGNGYSSDDLLGSLSGAATYQAANTFTQYNYQAFFGRLNYNWQDKYILNLTGRRDGSSRFGPDARFSNFGALGAAWLFSNEDFLKNNGPLSYGKLRGSYGVTGNDQIGDYAYLDTWSATSTYADSTTLAPTKLYNPNLQWERNTKLEIGLELGFFRDRILFTASAYQNITSNPLVSYPLPRTTGFSNIVNNLKGVEVQNRGLELTLNSKNIAHGSFKWSTDFNITLPKNILKNYPDLASSSYASSYVVGKSLNSLVSGRFLGVDPSTGLYTVQDLNGDGVINVPDYVVNGNTDPKYYGGLNNNFSFHRFSLSFFFQFNKQLGRDWRASNQYNPPGTIFNVPVLAMDRWQTAGQQTDVQKYTTSAGSLTGTSGFYAYMFSNGGYTDASFVRLKNVYLSYDVPVQWLSVAHISSCKFYLQGQNLFVISGYKGGDPEVQNYTRMAPLRTVTAGIQLSL